MLYIYIYICYIIIYIMAEGGFDNENPWLDHDLNHDGNDDDDNDDVEEVDTTRPFQPGTAYTPYHNNERIEMHTIPREQSGLPDTSFDENIPLLGDFIHSADKQKLVDKAMDLIKKKFPTADKRKLGPIGFSKKNGNENKIVSFGPKGGETEILKRDGSGLLKSFTDKFKNALGPTAKEILYADNTAIREERQRLSEAEKQLKQAERIAVERQQAATEVQNLRNIIEQTQAKMDVLEGEQGSNVESESELQRLKQLKKNLQADLENQKKN